MEKRTLIFIPSSTGQLDEGTLFVNGTSINTDQDIINWLTARFPGLYFDITDVHAIRELLKHYPTSPAAGSPYGTGDETFGQGAQYKRFASLFGDLLLQVSLVYCLRCELLWKRILGSSSAPLESGT